MEWFFKLNIHQEMKIQTVWDTSKAFFRGLMIRERKKQNLKQREKMEILCQNLKKEEENSQENPTNSKIRLRIKKLQHEINVMQIADMERKLKMAKQNFFENANKPGRWLAYRLKKERQRNIIQSLKDEAGQEKTGMEDIKRIVEQFYKDLYKRKEIDGKKQQNYILENNRLKLSEQQRNALEKQISLLEIKEAIMKQNVTKAPGPDGLSAQYYKKLEEILIIPYKELIDNIWVSGEIPDTWKEATITLIHKAQTEQNEIKNYRPISLLNVDYKIFATILASRLKNILGVMIHQDQAGFLPKRQLKKNMRVIMNVLEYCERDVSKKLGLIFLDAQKAFDNVNWNFMIGQLEALGCGQKFLSAIRGIYAKQTARVKINGDLTEDIQIQQGTRQGCPLSPLLFILSLEMLNTKIREDRRIKGLSVQGEEFKLQAYADDVVFILEDPKESIEFLMENLREYGEVAGMKINYQKTKLLLKNIKQSEKEELEKWGLQITNKVRYLGIIMTNKNSTLMEENYYKLLKEIQKDCEKWGKLQLSFMGRIASIKMNILPKLIFLFQTIPIILKKVYFQEIDKIVSKFVWQGKKPRIRMKLLQDVKERAGFGLPDFLVYYQAAALNWIREWIDPKDKRTIKLETYDLPVGLHAFLIYDKAKYYPNFKQHCLRRALLWVWDQLRYKIYDKIPCWVRPLEIASKPEWFREDQNRTYAELIDRNGGMLSKEQLELKDIILDWWSAAQIKSRIKEDGKIGIYQNNSEFDKNLLEEKEKFIKRMYVILLNLKMEDEIVKETMLKWARNFGYAIPLEQWEKIWKDNIKVMKAVSYKENIYKMFYRWHITPDKIARMYKNTSNICWKCKTIEGTYYHMWWTCAKAKNFWRKIHEMLQEILQCSIPFKPEMFLLNIFQDVQELEKKYFMMHAITAARLVFAQDWKGENIPSMEQVISKIYDVAEMDMLTERLREKKTNKTEQIWRLFYEWMDTKC